MMDDEHEFARQDMVRERQRTGVPPTRSEWLRPIATPEELDGLTIELHQPHGVDEVGVIVWDEHRILARTALHSHTPWEYATERIRDLIEEAKANRPRREGDI